MTGSRAIEIVNLTKNVSVGSRIRVAGKAIARLVGLLGTRKLEPGCGLLIEPSSGIHTFGMRFPIDVVSLDANLQVIGTWEKLAPCRLAAVHWKTRKVLELPVGTIRAARIEVNDQLGLNMTVAPPAATSPSGRL